MSRQWEQIQLIHNAGSYKLRLLSEKRLCSHELLVEIPLLKCYAFSSSAAFSRSLIFSHDLNSINYTVWARCQERLETQRQKAFEPTLHDECPNQGLSNTKDLWCIQWIEMLHQTSQSMPWHRCLDLQLHKDKQMDLWQCAGSTRQRAAQVFKDLPYWAFSKTICSGSN